ncbi:hypothetical protein DL769_004234 [Monosporascus sp. CRB-8-3]|nr:hypothetical protein DL769_004234 [Monosporascus sp. CRB-8-3]
MEYQGAAITQAHSLPLGGPDAATGSTPFGAIDTDKYEGDLMGIDSVATLTSARANSLSGVDELAAGFPVSAGIFVGRERLELPAELAFNMWVVAGAEYWPEKNTATVSCFMKDSEGSSTLGLGGSAGPKAINQTNPQNYHLGVASLQIVYAVFDLLNSQFAVAAPKLDSTASNIVPFAGNAAPIPSTVPVPDQPKTLITQSPTVSEMPTATKSFLAAARFQSSTSGILQPPNGESTNPAGQSDGPPEAGLTKGATIEIGVGAAPSRWAISLNCVKESNDHSIAADRSIAAGIPHQFRGRTKSLPVSVWFSAVPYYSSEPPAKPYPRLEQQSKARLDHDPVSTATLRNTRTPPLIMANGNLKFRVATPQDAARLQPLVRSAYRGEESRKGWTTEADLMTGERIDVAGLTAKITAPDGVVLIATAEQDEYGAPVSCCELCRRGDDLAYFGLFAVDPRCQAGGIGRHVLAYAEDYCRREWGARRLEMQVIGIRRELIEWYVRRGYRVTGETRPFPYGGLGNDVALRYDLDFQVLEKGLDTATAAKDA